MWKHRFLPLRCAKLQIWRRSSDFSRSVSVISDLVKQYKLLIPDEMPGRFIQEQWKNEYAPLSSLALAGAC